MPVETPAAHVPLTAEHLQQILADQRSACAAAPMPDAQSRRQWLDALREVLTGNQQALIEAISADFGNRSADETLLAEIMPSLHGIRYARRHLRGWMKPSRRRVGLAFQPASAWVIY